jgi:hypothetical protein
MSNQKAQKNKGGRPSDGIPRKMLSIYVHESALKRFQRLAKEQERTQAWLFNSTFGEEKPV